MTKLSLSIVFILNILDSDSWEELIEGQPTLLKLMPKLGLDVQTGMDLLCLVGMVMSFMCVIFKTARDTVSFILLWMLYLSLYQVDNKKKKKKNGYALIFNPLIMNRLSHCYHFHFNGHQAFSYFYFILLFS